MKNLMQSVVIIIAAVSFSATTSMAADQNDPSINVHQAWARATAPGQDVGAAYLMIVSKKDTNLVKIDTDAAEHTQIHSMTMNNGVMKMRELESLAIPAGTMVNLAPGGMHLMLIGLKKPLKAGEQLALTLQFKDNAGKLSSVNIQAIIQAGASEPDHHSM
ncbi:MAG: copper chaperone PCu(A)C [Methylophilaceae bacterium]|nr:copper chaperone PCu(A)C [Methyloradius sp.]